MDDPVLLRTKFLLSAFADDDEKPSNKNEVKEVSHDLLCGAIKGSSLVSTYSDARSIAKRGQFIYIDGNKCQVAEDAEWTSSKIQLAHDYDGDTNFNAIITIAPNPDQIKKNKKDKKKKVKPAPSTSSLSTISIQQSIASSDQPYSQILEKANSLLCDIKSSSVNIENSPTIATKPSKLKIKKHVSNLLNNNNNSNTIYDEENNDEDEDENDSHNVSVKSIHTKNSKSSVNAVNKHTNSSSPNINNNSFINKAITASHIPQSNDYHDESSSSYDKLYQNNSQAYTTGTSYTSLKADADKTTADMKRQVILNRLAQKMKEDKQKIIEKEIEEEKKKSELKWKSDQKAKQFKEITNERVAKRLKEEALKREELEKQKQLEDELKAQKAQETIETNQIKLRELKKETAKRLRQRELEKKKAMEDELKNIALKIEEMALQTGRSKVLLRPDNSTCTTSFRNHAVSHTKSNERHTQHQTIGRQRHNPSHTKTNSSQDDYDNNHDNDGDDEEEDNDLLSQDSLHQKQQKHEFYEENDYGDDGAEDGDDEAEDEEVELNEHYLKLMQNNNNMKQVSNISLNNDLANKAKLSINKSDNNNNNNSNSNSNKKTFMKTSSNKIDNQNNSKPNELQSVSKIPRAQIYKSNNMNIDNDIHNSYSQNSMNPSQTITSLERAHTSSSVIIDHKTENNNNNMNNIRKSSSASKFVDRTRQTINNAKKLTPISNNNSSKNPATITIKPTKSKENKDKGTNSASKDIQLKDEIGIIAKVRKMSDHSVFSEITTMEDENDDNEGLDEDGENEDGEYLLTNGLEKEKNIRNNQALGYEDYAVTAINVACKPKKKKQFQPWRKLKPISIPAYRPLPPSLTAHE